MGQSFDNVAGILDVPSPENFDEDTLNEGETYFVVKNFSLSKERKTSLLMNPDPVCPSGISDQSFQYAMVDFANRHGLEATLAKGNSIILAGTYEIPRLMHQEFGDRFIVEHRGAKYLKIMLRKMKKDLKDDRKGALPEPHYDS